MLLVEVGERTFMVCEVGDDEWSVDDDGRKDGEMINNKQHRGILLWRQQEEEA